MRIVYCRGNNHHFLSVHRGCGTVCIVDEVRITHLHFAEQHARAVNEADRRRAHLHMRAECTKHSAGRESRSSGVEGCVAHRFHRHTGRRIKTGRDVAVSPRDRREDRRVDI